MWKGWQGGCVADWSKWAKGDFQSRVSNLGLDNNHDLQHHCLLVRARWPLFGHYDYHHRQCHHYHQYQHH